MITEDYCSQEVVKLLEEKGFNNTSTIESITYNKLTKTLDFTYYKYVNGVKTLVTDNIDPSDLTHIWQNDKVTHALAMKWLREVKDIDIIIMPLFQLKGGRIYCYEIHSDTEDIRTGRFKTYEEAVEAALKYVLENLI